MYGCCADGQTPAAGPDAEGCPLRITCDMTAFGCCPDGETMANGFSKEGCPPTTTAETTTVSSTTLTVTTMIADKTPGATSDLETLVTTQKMSQMTTAIEASTGTSDVVRADTASSKLPTSQVSVTSHRPRKGCRRRTATTPSLTASTTTEFGLIC